MKPSKSDPTQWDKALRGECAQCGEPGTVVKDLVPFGTKCSTVNTLKNAVLLHDGCWPQWMRDNGKSMGGARSR